VTAAPPTTWRSLEALRGVAALLVMALHALYAAPSVYGSADPLDRWVLGAFVWGWVGVPVFFVLSGFVLTLPFLQAGSAGSPRPDVRPYLLRRAARVLPAFWLQLLLIALGLALLGGFPGVGGSAQLAQWPWQLSMAFHLDAAAHPWLGVWWTLPVELSFYLLLPWLLARRPGRRATWLAGLILAAILLRGIAGAELLPTPLARALAHHLPTRIDAFLIGVIAAHIWHARGAVLRTGHAAVLVFSGLLLALAMVLLVLGTQVPMPEPLPRRPWLAPWQSLFALGMGLLVLGLVVWERQRQLPRWYAPLVALGRVSYGVYLWHVPVLGMLAEVAAGRGIVPWPPILLLAALPPTLVLAWASWRFVEQPARAWVRQRWPYTTQLRTG
jgi:peptidoglycan/LPS O-acetylase OafA/YrhL